MKYVYENIIVTIIMFTLITKKDKQYNNLLMIINDSLYWYQQFLSTLTTKKTSRHATNAAYFNPS